MKMYSLYKSTNMEKKEQIFAYCRQFRTTGIANNLMDIIQSAEQKEVGYVEFTLRLLEAELAHRQANDLKRRRKAAQLPTNSDLNMYDHSYDNGLSKTRVSQLRELNWLDQGYNLMLTGPSGTGKTFLAAGLCSDAVEKGYKAYFKTMDELINMLKLKDLTRSAMTQYKRLLKADLIVIDDIMLFPVQANLAVAFFNLINQLYEKTCFIITTNKKAADWAKMLDDEVLATALLDRLLFHSDVISLTGKSYRLTNRKSFFDNEN